MHEREAKCFKNKIFDEKKINIFLCHVFLQS